MRLFAQHAIPEFDVEPERARKALSELKLRSAYFRVVEKDGQVVGWASADVKEPFPCYSSKKALVQAFYHSELTGIAAVRALYAIHEDMFEFARKLRLHAVITNSGLPNRRTFDALLQRKGWIDRGTFLIRLCTPSREQQP